jgi:hypothetical protein
MAPTRPDSHVIDNRAVAILKTIIPAKWIVREQGYDYGIDIGVCHKICVNGHNLRYT